MREGKSCLVYQAKCAPQGNDGPVMEALIMAHNVHQECAIFHKVNVHRRDSDVFRSKTLESFAAV